MSAASIRALTDGQGRVDPSRPGASATIDPSWEAFVAATPGGDLVQSGHWAAAKRAAGFEVAFVARRARERLVGGAHLVMRRFGPLGALGYVSRGPLLAPDASPEEADDVLMLVEQAARAHQVRHLVVQPPEAGTQVERVLAARGYAPGALEVAPTATLRLDLAASLETIFARMSASQRSHLRRSQRAGVATRMAGPDDLGLFWTLYEATARRHGFAPLAASYLRRQWELLYPAGHIQVCFAFVADRVLAAIWLSAFGDTVTYRLPGWSGGEPRLHPSAASFWGAIRWAQASGYRYFDFGGIDRRHGELLVAGAALPPEFQQSPDAMKLRFGGRPVLLPCAWQKTLNRAAWPMVRSVYPLVARTAWWRKATHRLRSG
jgi:lipid II:glycine glycyltransferase (peptidoglycan interpeptide bridge formation enzyme)